METLSDKIRNYFQLTPYMPILEWAKENIDFSADSGSERNSFDIELTPHLKEILEATDFRGKIKELTVCGIQQHGKTLIEEIFLLYSMIYTPCNSLTVYPSDQLAAEINVSKLRPLMSKIPALKAEMTSKRAIRADRYKFSNFISFWQGAGTKIVSKSCKIRIADEVDQWPVIGRLNNVEDLRKRARAYSESMYLKVCTPTTENGRIWKEFLKSSQGYWTLWCDNCQDWTMRSCDLHNLQFESVFNEQLNQYMVKPESIVLVCPKCGYEHKEEEKREMNLKGKYIHKIPERLETHPGFQFGVLCSLFHFMSWQRIAQKILQSGKRSDIESHIELDNSWKGLPYKRREIVKEDFEKIKEHCWKMSEAPSLENVEIVFMTADTQDNRSVVNVFAMDVSDNLYLLEACQPEYLSLNDDDRAVINSKRDKPIVTVEDILKKEYLKKDGVGLSPVFCVIDRQGHRSADVEYFAKRNPQVLMYQGYRSQSNSWKMSDNNKRLCFVSAKYYQTHLIYYLYSQKKRGQNYLYFYPEVGQQVIKQILAVKPDSSSKFGHLPENWVADGQHDFFDTLKMGYFAMDFAVKSFRKERFRFCKSPQLLRRWEKLIKKQEQEQIKSAESASKKQSWFNVE